MGGFDYKKAWEKVAKPAADKLDENIFDLYQQVCREAKVLSQGEDLDMPWPEDSTLKENFGKLTNEQLAFAAHVLYFFGHWSPLGHSQVGSGGTWKFANYADQVLRERCGISRESNSGWDFQIHEGCLRVTYGSDDTWVWENVCPVPEVGDLEELQTGIVCLIDEMPGTPDEQLKVLKNTFWPSEGEWSLWRNIVEKYQYGKR